MILRRFLFYVIMFAELKTVQNALIHWNGYYEYYDERKKQCALEHGYKIYYIWEHDVNECLSECLAYCKSLIEE